MRRSCACLIEVKREICKTKTRDKGDAFVKNFIANSTLLKELVKIYVFSLLKIITIKWCSNSSAKSSGASTWSEDKGENK